VIFCSTQWLSPVPQSHLLIISGSALLSSPHPIPFDHSIPRDLAVITNLATKRLVLAVSATKRDELDSTAVDAVEQGFGARVGVGGLACCVEDLVDG